MTVIALGALVRLLATLAVRAKPTLCALAEVYVAGGVQHAHAMAAACFGTRSRVTIRRTGRILRPERLHWRCNCVRGRLRCERGGNVFHAHGLAKVPVFCSHFTLVSVAFA